MNHPAPGTGARGEGTPTTGLAAKSGTWPSNARGWMSTVGADSAVLLENSNDT